MKKKFFLTFLLILIININLYSKNLNPKSNFHNIELNNLVNHALINNYELKSAFYEWKSELEKIVPAKTLTDPKFEFGYFVKSVETRVGPQKWKMTLMQMFPWFGKLKYKTKSAEQMADMKLKVYEIKKLKLIYEIKKKYYNYYLFKRKKDIISQNIELLKHFEEIAQTKYKTSIGQQSAVIKVQVEIGKLEDMLISLKKMLDVLKIKINLAINRDIEDEIKIPDLISTETLVLSKDLALKLVFKKNPMLKKIKSEIIKEEFQMKFEKTKKYPDIGFGLSYVSTDKSEMPNVNNNGKDPLMVMVSFNLPIWTSKYKSLENKSLKKIESLNQRYEQKKNNFKSEIEMSYFEYEDAVRKKSLYKDTLIPKAQQSINVAETAVTIGGNIDFLNLIDSQRILLGFELELEETLVKINIATAKIKMLTGEN